MSLKRIHVNQHLIRANRNEQTDKRPVFTVKCKGKTYRAHDVEMCGFSALVYRPNSPLSCGAVAWVETLYEVRLYSKTGKCFRRLK